MDKKLSSYAGWLVYIPMLFMSVFYLLTSGFLQEGGGTGAIICVAVCIFVAFFGTKLAANFYRPLRAQVRKRPFWAARVYIPFIVWVSLSCALFVVFLNILTSIFAGTPFWGLTGFYPMLMENVTAHPAASFFLLVLMPAVLEEVLLRGTVYPLCEREGTAAAVFFSALVMPLMYVYPQAAMAGLVIGGVGAVAGYMTDALCAAVAVHLACRTALWIGDFAAASEVFMEYAGIFVCILLFSFFICVYQSLRNYEGLLRDELLHPAKPGAADATVNLRHLFLTAGFGLFAATFIIRFISMIVSYL